MYLLSLEPCVYAPIELVYFVFYKFEEKKKKKKCFNVDNGFCSGLQSCEVTYK